MLSALGFHRQKGQRDIPLKSARPQRLPIRSAHRDRIQVAGVTKRKSLTPGVRRLPIRAARGRHRRVPQASNWEKFPFPLRSARSIIGTCQPGWNEQPRKSCNHRRGPGGLAAVDLPLATRARRHGLRTSPRPSRLAASGRPFHQSGDHEEAIFYGVFGKAVVVLPSRKPFFLGGGDQRAVSHQACGAVVVEG